MVITRIEQDICRFVVHQFLERGEVTRKEALLKQFKESLADALRKLSDRAVLRSVEQTYGNETYLPRAIAFHYCGDPAALAFAQRSTETVLRILLTLYEQELDKEPQEHKQFSASDVQAEAHNLKLDVDEKMIRVGLYFAEEFNVFWLMKKDASQIFLTSFRVGEQIFDVMKVSNPWYLHILRGRGSVERPSWERQPPTDTSFEDTMDVPKSASASQILTEETSDRIFLVHGHAEKIEQTVSTFLKTLNLEVVILHEQPNRGRTVVEKFEKHSDVGFAVVLLTPDDIGAPINTPDKTKKRARQNVILELGYFIGKLAGCGKSRKFCNEEAQSTSNGA